MCSSRLGEVSSRAQASSSSGMRSPLRASARRAAPLGPGSPSRSASARCSSASSASSRVGEIDAPGGEARVRDLELVPAGAGREQVGPGVRGAALREPQPAAGLEEERGRERAGRRVAEQAGPGQLGVGVLELVELGQGVDQERERPQHRRRRGDGQLVLERDARVGLGVARAARAHERHRAHHAAVGERDQPAARARRVDQGIALGERRVELVVEDQHQAGDAAEQRVVLEDSEDGPAAARGPAPRARRPSIAAIAALTRQRSVARGAAHPLARLGAGAGVRPRVRHVLGLQAGERLGRQVAGVVEHRAGDVHRGREVAAEAERAGAPQRQLAALHG